MRQVAATVTLRFYVSAERAQAWVEQAGIDPEDNEAVARLLKERIPDELPVLLDGSVDEEVEVDW